MRIRLHKVALSAVLVIALLLTLASGVSATEPVTEPVPTETAASTEAATEPPVTEPPETVPEETIPEETEPEGYIVDRTSAIYNICAQMAETMQARQILVYDTNTDTILYSKSVAGGKLYPASITKLFSTYVALQYLDPDTVITAGDELDLVHGFGRPFAVYLLLSYQKEAVDYAFDAAVLLQLLLSVQQSVHASVY